MLMAMPGAAQTPPAAETQITPLTLPLNPDLSRATLFQRLDADVVYVDTATGPIPMDGSLKLPPPEGMPDTPISPTTARISRGVLAATALVLGVLLWRNRAALMARLAAMPGSGTARRAPRRAAAVAQGTTGAEARLAEIAAMPDRAAAMAALIELVLHAAADTADLRLSRAETARDLLRRLPRDYPHLADLRRLIMAGELVVFGGRGLSDRGFASSIARAAGLLGVTAPEVFAETERPAAPDTQTAIPATDRLRA